MISFCKSGGLILMDSDGKLHYFDPDSSLRDIAKYVWSRKSLQNYRIDVDSLGNDQKRFEHVEVREERVHRLRRPFSIYDDAYYLDVV